MTQKQKINIAFYIDTSRDYTISELVNLFGKKGVALKDTVSPDPIKKKAGTKDTSLRSRIWTILNREAKRQKISEIGKSNRGGKIYSGKDCQKVIDKSLIAITEEIRSAQLLKRLKEAESERRIAKSLVSEAVQRERDYYESGKHNEDLEIYQWAKSTERLLYELSSRAALASTGITAITNLEGEIDCLKNAEAEYEKFRKKVDEQIESSESPESLREALDNAHNNRHGITDSFLEKEWRNYICRLAVEHVLDKEGIDIKELRKAWTKKTIFTHLHLGLFDEPDGDTALAMCKLEEPFKNFKKQK